MEEVLPTARVLWELDAQLLRCEGSATTNQDAAAIGAKSPIAVQPNDGSHSVAR